MVNGTWYDFLSIEFNGYHSAGNHKKVKSVLNGHSNGFQYQLLLYAGQKYCRMLQGEHSAILSTFIKLPFSIRTFVLSLFK